jgi:hypothetical protein
MNIHKRFRYQSVDKTIPTIFGRWDWWHKWKYVNYGGQQKATNKMNFYFFWRWRRINLPSLFIICVQFFFRVISQNQQKIKCFPTVISNLFTRKTTKFENRFSCTGLPSSFLAQETPLIVNRTLKYAPISSSNCLYTLRQKILLCLYKQ